MSTLATTRNEGPSGEPGARERILEAAREEFADRGRAGASVRAIGARARVTPAMINYYFGGKDALYEQIVDEAQVALGASMARALASPEEASVPARLAGAYFDFLSEHHRFQRLLVREILDGGEGLRAYASRYVLPLRDRLGVLFGDDDGSFDAALSIFGAVAAYFLYEPVIAMALDGDPLSEERLARRRKHVMELADLLHARGARSEGETTR